MKRGVHAAAWLGLVLAAVLLWPQRWGGTMTYDITRGASMQPAFRSGDLAVLRTSRTYRVGDVAAYRSRTLNTTVMHRIIRATPQGYSFRGDNNGFVDPDTVTEREMLGKLVVRVPGVGRVLAWLLKPVNLLLLVGAVFLLLSDRRDQQLRAQQSTGAAGRHLPGRPGTEPPPAPATAPVIVRITELRLPEQLPTAELADPADLAVLARLHGIAVLRGPDADYLLQGGLLYRAAHEPAQAAPAPGGGRAARRRSPHGRDWDYREPAAVVSLDSRRAG